MPCAAGVSMRSSVALRTARGSRRISSPLSSIRSNAHTNTSASCWLYRIRSNEAMPSASHETNAGQRAQLGERLDNKRKAVSQIITRTAIEAHAFGFLPAITRKPSCLISSHSGAARAAALM